MAMWNKEARWCSVPAEQRRACAGLNVERAYFRIAFAAQRNEAITLALSAVDRYRLFVNGAHVAAGPMRGDRFRHFIDEVDLAPYLADGENVVAVAVTSYVPGEALDALVKGPVAVWSRAGGPLLLARSDSRPDLDTQSGNWRVLGDRSTTWVRNQESGYTAPTEVCAYQDYPRGWMDRGYAAEWPAPDLRWGNASNLWGELPPMPLYERTLPLFPMRKRAFARAMQSRDEAAVPYALPLTLPPYCRAVLELDMGELIDGFFFVKTQGGAGGCVRATYAETYKLPDGTKADRCDTHNGSISGKFDELWPDGGACSFERLEMHALRFVRLELQTADQALTLSDVGAWESGYPLEAPASFTAPEHWMQPVWDISLRTLRRCMYETYMDCPYYEQLQYIQDTRLQMLYTYRCDGDARLPRQTLDDFHASLLPEGILQARYPCQITQVIPNFALHWIFMLEDYVWQTGDESPALLYRPTVDAVLSWFDRRLTKDGLVGKLPYWPYFDWVEGWKTGNPPAADSEAGVASVFSMTYVIALRTASRLVRKERPALAQEYDARADRLVDALNRLCYDEKAGVYLDGPGRTELSQHAQVFAVLCGAAAGARAHTALMHALQDESMAPCSFTMQYYLFRALETAGMYDRTAALWDLWKGLPSLNLTTVPEVPGPRTRSDCHAWGALALYEFPAKFAGLSPDAPGWAAIRVEPKALWLLSFQGAFPTPGGMADIAWEKTGDRLRLHGRLPAVPATLVHAGREHVLSAGGDFDVLL